MRTPKETLPMPFPPDVPSLPATHGAAAPLPLRGSTVLVVEDSRVTCDALRLIFRRTGARLRRAETLMAARAHLDCYRPDLVIVDLGLPDGRGEALIAEASAQGLPVLTLSGDPEGSVAALEAGAIAFVEKPIPSVAGFLRLIRQLVAGVGAEPQGEEIAAPQADPLALRDDLARAVALVSGRDADPDYATGFVRSLARASGDTELEGAALQAGTDAGRRALADMVAARLVALQPVP
jgi:CheY-like chemotaxis protein